MAGATKATNACKRLSERCRLLILIVLAVCLHTDETVAVRDRLDPDRLADMIEGLVDKTTLRDAKKSPVTRATDFILSSERLVKILGHSGKIKKNKRAHVKANCRYWFKQIAMTNRQSLADQPRATKADFGLSDEDFKWLGNELLSQEWQDGQGNRRRYTGLEAMLQGCTQASEATDNSPAERDDARRVVKGLLDIKHKATCGAQQNLDLLLKRVAEKCGYVRPALLHACARDIL